MCLAQALVACKYLGLKPRKLAMLTNVIFETYAKAAAYGLRSSPGYF